MLLNEKSLKVDCIEQTARGFFSQNNKTLPVMLVFWLKESFISVLFHTALE